MSCPRHLYLGLSAFASKHGPVPCRAPNIYIWDHPRLQANTGLFLVVPRTFISGIIRVCKQTRACSLSCPRHLCLGLSAFASKHGPVPCRAPNIYIWDHPRLQANTGLFLVVPRTFISGIIRVCKQTRACSLSCPEHLCLGLSAFASKHGPEDQRSPQPNYFGVTRSHSAAIHSSNWVSASSNARTSCSPVRRRLISSLPSARFRSLTTTWKG